MTSASPTGSHGQSAAPTSADRGTRENLARLANLLSDGLTQGGFGEQRFVLIHLREPDDFPEGFELGVKSDLDGHPVDALLGFVCPEEWTAFGCSHVGWASPSEGLRPSEHPERERVRITALVHRSGVAVTVVRFESGRELSDISECRGMIPDALRRALGVPTSPPEEPVRAFTARVWLESVLREARRKPAITWNDVTTLEPHATSESWSDLRWSVITERRAVDEVSPEIAAWMDDGMFARWTAPDAALFDALERAVGPSITGRLRRRLREWQVV